VSSRSSICCQCRMSTPGRRPRQVYAAYIDARCMCESLSPVPLKTAMLSPLTSRLLSLAIVVTLVTGALSQTQQACDLGASVTETVDLPLAAGKLAELHIRHNLKVTALLYAAVLCVLHVHCIRNASSYMYCDQEMQWHNVCVHRSLRREKVWERHTATRSLTCWKAVWL